MANVIIDFERAKTVFGALLETYIANRFPYDNAKPPQRPENLPRNLMLGTVEHANFLWAVCYYMRGGIKSDTAIIALARMHEECPELFVPRYLHEDSSLLLKSSMAEKLQDYGLGFNSKEIPNFWIANAQKLERFWGGDVRSLFVDVDDYDMLCERIIGTGKRRPDHPHGFYGFQYKMTSMIAYFLQEAGLIAPLLYPVPVDFHVLRVLVANEILTVPGSDKILPLPDLQEAARELTSWYCREYSVSPVHLCDVLWLLSSSTCNQNPGNFSEIGEYKARATQVTPTIVNWTEAEVAAHIRTCARCPIRETCRHCIPSGPYYRQGEMHKQPRTEPPLPAHIIAYLAQGYGHNTVIGNGHRVPEQSLLLPEPEVVAPTTPPKRPRRRTKLVPVIQTGSEQTELSL
jgi:hypothetical protein